MVGLHQGIEQSLRPSVIQKINTSKLVIYMWLDSGKIFSNETFTESIEIQTGEKVVFDGCTFNTVDTPIRVYFDGTTDIEVRNCVFNARVPVKNNETQGRTIHVYGYNKPGSSFLFENNNVIGYRGVWLQEMPDTLKVSIQGNIIREIQGRPADGNGGFKLQPDPNGENSQAISVAEVTGPNIDIDWNVVENTPYESKVEDVISIFACKGTADSPLSISNNLIVGSYDYNPVANKSYSGSGIQVESGSQFCKIEGNVVVQAGNTALALSWVSDSVVKDNVVVNTGFLEDGSMVAQVWRGLLLGNPGWPQGEAGTKRNVASGNYIQYPQNIEDGSQRWGDSIHVAAGNSSTDKAITTPATKADEQKAIDDYWARVTNLGVSIGVGGVIPDPDPDPDPDEPGDGNGDPTDPPTGGDDPTVDLSLSEIAKSVYKASNQLKINAKKLSDELGTGTANMSEVPAKVDELEAEVYEINIQMDSLVDINAAIGKFINKMNNKLGALASGIESLKTLM